MAITKEQIADQLRQVIEPQLHRDIVTLNLVKQVSYCDGHALVKLEFASTDPALRNRVTSDIKSAVRQLGAEIQEVKVEYTTATAPTPQERIAQSNPLPGIKHIIAVGAGKGGVGKSTIAVNLAVGLARLKLRVGLLDGDIYGPSAPTLLGLNGQSASLDGKMIVPFNVHGIRAMTLGALVEEDKPLIWRGPMAHGAFSQLAMQTQWGDLDYLIIDLPPGTGDVPLTMSQILPLSGAVVVCTPQKLAQDDARRAVRMFEQLDVELLGAVENMSYFIGDDGKEYDLFGKGGARRMAQDMHIPFLGAVPIHMSLRANSDAGNPTANFTGNPGLAGELQAVVANVLQQIEQRAESGAYQGPTISIH